MNHFQLQPILTAIWTGLIVVALVVVFARIVDNLRHIRAYRRELLLTLYRIRSKHVCPIAKEDIKHAYSLIRKRPWACPGGSCRSDPGMSP